MFTGIVEEIGMVRELSSNHLLVGACELLQEVNISDSIAVNGACLTVAYLDEHGFGVDVMPETLRRTNIGRLRYGDKVNLERALVVGGRLGGHLVLGHADDTGEVMRVSSEGDARLMRISAPVKLMPYIVDKGFITVDGVSLTIAELDNYSFAISLVTYTSKNTILGNRNPGDMVNLEADIIAKYVESLGIQRERSLTLDFLKEYGFVEGNFKC